ncbi:hypothetical protein ABW21_db0201006 [Orbilia brochopaga]|nr:hypothetical protein ABW21_db0201006 [Drechslerella brochopaga]
MPIKNKKVKRRGPVARTLTRRKVTSKVQKEQNETPEVIDLVDADTDKEWEAFKKKSADAIAAIYERAAKAAAEIIEGKHHKVTDTQSKHPPGDASATEGVQTGSAVEHAPEMAGDVGGDGDGEWEDVEDEGSMAPEPEPKRRGRPPKNATSYDGGKGVGNSKAGSGSGKQEAGEAEKSTARMSSGTKGKGKATYAKGAQDVPAAKKRNSEDYEDPELDAAMAEIKEEDENDDAPAPFGDLVNTVSNIMESELVEWVETDTGFVLCEKEIEGPVPIFFIGYVIEVDLYDVADGKPFSISLSVADDQVAAFEDIQGTLEDVLVNSSLFASRKLLHLATNKGRRKVQTYTRIYDATGEVDLDRLDLLGEYESEIMPGSLIAVDTHLSVHDLTGEADHPGRVTKAKYAINARLGDIYVLAEAETRPAKRRRTKE